MSEARDTSEDGARQRRRPTPLAVFAAVAVVIRLYLGWGFPPVIQDSIIDDGLWADQALHIAAGEWLGRYDELTLMRGVGYPLFLAGTMRLGVPAQSAVGLLHAVAALAVLLALRRTGLAPGPAAAAFLATLFTPAAFGDAAARLGPETLIVPQALLACALLFGLVAARTWRGRVLASVALGVLGVWAAQTDECAAWLGAGMAMAAVALAAVTWRRTSSPSRTLAALAAAALPAAVAAWGCVGWIEHENAEAYGVTRLTERDDPAFQAALGALSRVAEPRRYEPLGRQTRRALAEASPAFRSLAPVFEGASFGGPGNRVEGSGRRAEARMWTLRHAAARAGHHATPERARAFYRQLAGEIDAAVDRGDIAGGEPRASGRPPLRASLLTTMARVFWDRAGDVWRLRHALVSPAPRPPRAAAGEKRVERFERVMQASLRSGAHLLVERTHVLDRIRRVLRVLFTTLVFFALVATLTQVALVRERGVDALLAAELVAFSIVATSAVTAAAYETFWSAASPGRLVAAYAVFPVWLVMALHAYTRFPDFEAAPALSSRVRARLATAGRALAWGAPLLLIGLLGSSWWHDGRRAHFLDARTLRAGGLADFPASLQLEPGRLERLDDGVRFTATGDDPVIVLTPVDPDLKEPRDLVLEAAFEGVAQGEPWYLSWSARPGAEPFSRLLFTKGGRRHRWRVPLGTATLSRLAIKPPEGDGVRCVLGSFELVEGRGEAPEEKTPDDVLFEARLGRSSGELHARIRGGEAESLYQVFLSRKRREPPGEVPGFRGVAGLDVPSTVEDGNGDYIRLRLTTDEFGNGEVRAKFSTVTEEALPLYVQAIGLTHLTKVVELRLE